MVNNASGTLVTFDYEGLWGMPHDAPYDLHETTRTILEILRRYDVNAMFFVVGRLVEEAPELIATIAEEGHAIGLHGYRHEPRLDSFAPAAISSLQVELKSVCGQVEQLTGSPPIAFRAPHLLWPKFSDPSVSAMLVELGFLWMSNREIRFVEEAFRPGRLGWPGARRLASSLGIFSETSPLGALAFAVLNARFLFGDNILESPVKRLRWLLGTREPFERSGLVEVALAAPLDCDLIGLPLPSESTADALLSFATDCLIRGKLRHGNPYVLTFHDWIIGTGNRVAMLDSVLGALRNEGPMFDARSWLPQVGG